jgi:hypothetical protein
VGEPWRTEPADREFAPAGPGTVTQGDTDQPTGQIAAPADSPEPVPEIASRGSAATSYGDLATIIRLQSTELERLALEKERLMDRLEKFFRLHENDQRLRQDLQLQIQRLTERVEAAAPAYDADAIRREAREGMIEEVKPVLVAILELLERSLERRPGEPEETPPQTAGHTLPMEEFLRLPEILTRPLEELTMRVGETPAPRPVSNQNANAPARSEPSENRGYRAPPGPALPGVFTWTNLFS